MNIEIKKISNGYIISFWFNDYGTRDWWYVKNEEEIEKYIKDKLAYFFPKPKDGPT